VDDLKCTGSVGFMFVLCDHVILCDGCACHTTSMIRRGWVAMSQNGDTGGKVICVCVWEFKKRRGLGRL
jgi:hypothetical protein